MKATLSWAGALVAALLSTGAACAIDPECSLPSYPNSRFRHYNGPIYYPGYRVVPGPMPTAPDMMGPGSYTLSPNNVWYGPNYCVRPPFPPFQGVLPGKQGQEIAAGRPACFAPSPGGPAGNGLGNGLGNGVGNGLGNGVGNGFGAGPGAAYSPYARNYGMLPGYGGNSAFPNQNGGAAANAFPTHPYARSPRDFFMWRENMEEETARGSRPSLVP